MEKTKVILRAPLLTNSGYGVHSRQIFQWLDKKEDVDLTVECLNWGATSWIIDPDDLGGLAGKIMQKSRPVVKGSYDISFQVQLPDEWDENLAVKNIGVTAAVETDICNPVWIEKINKMDEVIVPSSFTRNVLINSGIVLKNINVVHEWFNRRSLDKSGIDKSLQNEEYKKIDGSFNFLLVGQLTALNSEVDRKNIFNTIKWFCEEFEGDENVSLVIKTNLGKSSNVDKTNVLSLLKGTINSFRKSDFPKVKVLHGKMSDLEIMSLYNHRSIKCYVSCTRGEGYGLPLIEAASSGLPVVATNWSGHLDFLNEKFYPVDYTLKSIPDSRVDNRIFVKGSKWACANEDSFKNKIREVYENYEKAKDQAKHLKKEVLHNFNSQKISDDYNKIFKRIIKNG